MEFLCLKCFSTFEVPDDQLPEPGGMLVCPVCGHKQPFAGVKRGAQQPTRKLDRKSTVSAKKVPEAPDLAPVSEEEKENTESPESKDIYIVESPSGLSFEFPNINLLIKWGEIITNPAPYKVYLPEGPPVSLEEFLKEKSSVRKSSKRKRVKKKRLAEEPKEEGVDQEKTEEKKKQRHTTVTNTRQFQFRTAEVERESSRWTSMIIFLLLGLLLGAAGFFAYYVFVMQK